MLCANFQFHSKQLSLKGNFRSTQLGIISKLEKNINCTFKAPSQPAATALRGHRWMAEARLGQCANLL